MLHFRFDLVSSAQTASSSSAAWLGCLIFYLLLKGWASKKGWNPSRFRSSVFRSDCCCVKFFSVFICILFLCMYIGCCGVFCLVNSESNQIVLHFVLSNFLFTFLLLHLEPNLIFFFFLHIWNLKYTEMLPQYLINNKWNQSRDLH